MTAVLLGLPGWLYALPAVLVMEAVHHKTAILALLVAAGVWCTTRLRSGRHARLVSRPHLTSAGGRHRKHGRHEVAELETAA